MVPIFIERKIHILTQTKNKLFIVFSLRSKGFQKMPEKTNNNNNKRGDVEFRPHLKYLFVNKSLQLSFMKNHLKCNAFVL